MADYAYTVDIGGVLTNVQSITVTRGRVQVQDPFKAGTATITGRNVSSLPTIDIGDTVEITATSGIDTFEIFIGIVADIKISYGQVASMDTWQIDCEDVLARVGRSLTTSSFSWSAGIEPGDAAEQTVTDASGGALTVLYNPMFPSSSRVSAQSLPNTNALQVLNQLAATEQGWLRAKTETVVEFIGRNEIGTGQTYGTFTDGTLVDTGLTAPYDVVDFRSQADSFYQEVVVEPEGLASQKTGSGARRYSLASYDQSTTQAKNLADYVLATLQVQDSVPSVISAISQVQSNTVAMRTFESAASGSRVELILRGVRYVLFVEGATLTATPEQTRWSYNLVSSDAISFFILDSTTLGVLDQNKLGF